MLNDDGDDAVDVEGVEGGRVLKEGGELGGGRGWPCMMKMMMKKKKKKGEGRENREEYYIINCGVHLFKIIKVESLGTLL